LKWSFREGEAMGRAPVTGREEDEAAWLDWAARAEKGGTVAAMLHSGIRRKKKARRLTGRARLAVTEGGWVAIGPARRPWPERREAGWVAVAHKRGEGKRARRGRKRGGPQLGQKVSLPEFQRKRRKSI
jgi:hypothetical protein